MSDDAFDAVEAAKITELDVLLAALRLALEDELAFRVHRKGRRAEAVRRAVRRLAERLADASGPPSEPRRGCARAAWYVRNAQHTILEERDERARWRKRLAPNPTEEAP